MRVAFPQKNNFATLTANRIVCPDYDTSGVDMIISRDGAVMVNIQADYFFPAKDIRIATNKKIRDVALNILIDPDDVGGFTSLADVANSPTFNGIPVTRRYLEGVANKEFVPCIYIGELTNKGVEWDGSGYEQQNIDADDIDPYYILPLPTNLYGKKLYVKDVHVEVTGANATNKIDHMYVKGVVYGGPANLQSEPAVLDGIEDKVYSLTAADASGYTYVAIKLSWIVTDAGILQIRGVAIEAYYDT